MKLENLVIPLFAGLSAAAVASGINKDVAKSGVEAATTYIVAVPIGATAGYLIDRLGEYLKSKGYDFSRGLPHP